MYRSKNTHRTQFGDSGMYPDDPGMHNTGSKHHGRNHTTISNNTTFLERMSHSFTGAMLGFGMFVVSFFILFLNEGKAVQTAQSLEKSLHLVIPITNNKVIFQENNYKLVHLTGKLKTDQPLVDVLFDVHVPAVKLRREVSMFQWVEHQKKQDVKEGSDSRIETDIMYIKEWKPFLVDSNTFNNPTNHQNPKEMTVSPMTFIAIHTYIGNYMIKDSLKEKINTFKPYVPTKEPSNPNVHLIDGKFYQTDNPFRPKVGDMRVTYSYAGVSGDEDSILGDPDTVSVIAKQSGNQLTKYKTDTGESLELVHFGEKTAQEMIEDELHASSTLTWTLRFGGWLMMLIGLNFMTNILYTLVDWFPILGTMVSIGLSAFNFCASISLSVITISAGWLWYRPILSLTFIALASVPPLLSYIRANKIKQEFKV